jgi:hypothetical protein
MWCPAAGFFARFAVFNMRSSGHCLIADYSHVQDVQARGSNEVCFGRTRHDDIDEDMVRRVSHDWSSVDLLVVAGPSPRSSVGRRERSQLCRLQSANREY